MSGNLESTLASSLHISHLLHPQTLSPGPVIDVRCAGFLRISLPRCRGTPAALVKSASKADTTLCFSVPIQSLWPHLAIQPSRAFDGTPTMAGYCSACGLVMEASAFQTHVMTWHPYTPDNPSPPDWIEGDPPEGGVPIYRSFEGTGRLARARCGKNSTMADGEALLIRSRSFYCKRKFTKPGLMTIIG